MKLDDVAVIEKVTGVLPCLLYNPLNLTRGHTLHPNTVPTRHTAPLVAARYGDHHEVARGNLPIICGRAGVTRKEVAEGVRGGEAVNHRRTTIVA
jgi:hypothetical protein